jgi:DNA-binding response OmpR family regulator
MPPRTIKLLHVEDDDMQQRVITIQLGTITELSFDITVRDSEDAAVAAFQQGGFEFVLLDYHLTQGDGLSCLRKLRARDPVVPIIAISGKATPEIAAELLQVGADDYLSKEELKPEALARSVRGALARADAWRQQAAPAEATVDAGLRNEFEALCRRFAATYGTEILGLVNAFEAKAREKQLTAEQLEGMVAAARHESQQGQGDTSQPRVLRPLFLEILLRLFGTENG